MQLPLTKRKSRGHIGPMKTISVDKMYSSQPCSKSRDYVSDSDESDDEKCLQSENLSSSRFTKR